jgi:hypothetical protein
MKTRFEPKLPRMSSHEKINKLLTLDLNSGPPHHQPVFCHQIMEDTLNRVTMQILIYTIAIDVWSAVSSPLGGLYVSVMSSL